jgi:hypothetical protein
VRKSEPAFEFSGLQVAIKNRVSAEISDAFVSRLVVVRVNEKNPLLTSDDDPSDHQIVKKKK